MNYYWCRGKNQKCPHRYDEKCSKFAGRVRGSSPWRDSNQLDQSCGWSQGGKPWSGKKFCPTYGNSLTEDEVLILDQIRKSNYCTSNDDCRRIQSKYPFGCCTYVNKNRTNYINSLINKYYQIRGQYNDQEREIEYKCQPCLPKNEGGCTCLQGKCRSLF